MIVRSSVCQWGRHVCGRLSGDRSAGYRAYCKLVDKSLEDLHIFLTDKESKTPRDHRMEDEVRFKQRSSRRR